MKIMLSKALVLAVIVLFIGAGFVPSITSEKDIGLNIINNKTVGLSTTTLTYYPTDDSTIAHPDPDSPCGSHTEIAIRNEYGSGGNPGWAGEEDLRDLTPLEEAMFK